MSKGLLFKLAAGTALLCVVLALYWLTAEDPADPCDPQLDISAAILADENGDQDGLANRAIIMRGACDENSEASAP